MKKNNVDEKLIDAVAKMYMDYLKEHGDEYEPSILAIVAFDAATRFLATATRNRDRQTEDLFVTDVVPLIRMAYRQTMEYQNDDTTLH